MQYLVPVCTSQSHTISHLFSTHCDDVLLSRVWTWTQAFEHSRVMLFRFAVQPSIQTMTVGKGWRRGMHQTLVWSRISTVMK